MERKKIHLPRQGSGKIAPKQPENAVTSQRLSSREPTSAEQELICHGLFLRFDPILRQLVGMLQLTHAPEAAKDMNPIKASPTQEIVIQTLQSEILLLQRLRQAVRESAERNMTTKQSMKTMWNYILLPALFIFKQYGPKIATMSTPTTKNIDLAMNSLYFRCTEEATLLMTTFYDLLGCADNQKEIIGGDMVEKMVSQSLIALASALPVEAGKDVKSKIKDESMLERQDHLNLAYLMCIRTICEFVASENMNNHFKKIDIGKEMGGALVARLTQYCLQILTNVTCTGSYPLQEMGKQITEPKLGIAAIETLDKLLDASPSPSCWRDLFPGYFATLVRVLLKDHNAIVPPKLLASCTSILCLLLRTTLAALTLTDKNLSSTTAQQLLIESVKRAGGVSKLLSNSDQQVNKKQLNSKDARFVKEVVKRLPSSLSVIIQQLEIRKSAKVQSAVIDLCKCILIDTRSFWMEHKVHETQIPTDASTTLSLKLMENTASECCLGFLNSKNQKVRSSARDTMDSYFKFQAKEQVMREMVPRIIELLEALPAETQSGREDQCSKHIELIRGYLSLTDIFYVNDKSYSPVLSETNTLRKALMFPTCTHAMAKAMSALFELDIESTPIEPVVDITPFLGSSQDTSTDITPLRSQRLTLFANQDSTFAARTLMRSLGRALGRDNCLSFIEESFVGIRDDFLIDSGNKSSFGLSQIKWLRSSIGILVSAQEMVLGLSKESDIQIELAVTATASPAFRSVTSILRLMFQSPLWDLPVTQEQAQTLISLQSNKILSEGELYDRYFSHPDSISTAFLSKQVGESIFTPEVSSNALRGNALFIAQGIYLVSATFDVLGTEIQVLLPEILYPLLERASPYGNHPVVQEAAVLALSRAANATKCRSITQLLARNFDYIAEAITCRLRAFTYNVTDGTSFPPAFPCVIDAVMKFCKGYIAEDDQSIADDYDINYPPLMIENQRLILADLLRMTMRSFDRATVDSNLVVESMFSMFSSSIDFLCAAVLSSKPKGPSIENKMESLNLSEIESLRRCKPWLEGFLQEFGKNTAANISLAQDFLNRQEHQSEQSYDTDENDNDDENLRREIIKTDSLSIEVALVNDMMEKGAFFLSHSDLRVQLVAADSILKGVYFIQTAERIAKNQDEQNGGNGSDDPNANNMLLPSINEIWPPIHARLAAASEAIVDERKNDSKSLNIDFNARQALSNKTDTVHYKIRYSTAAVHNLLAKLLDLTSSLCEISKEFMCSRFENDVWPHLVRILQQHTYTLSSKSYHRLYKQQRNVDEIISIFRCIERVFSVPECGTRLSHLVTVVGTIVLPFIGNSNRSVSDSASGVIQAILRINSECLWFELTRFAYESVSDDVDQSFKLQCQALLDYADTLDEQEI